MARDFFRAEKGIHITGENVEVGVHCLFGSAAPGSASQEDNAEVGSLMIYRTGDGIAEKDLNWIVELMEDAALTQ